MTALELRFLGGLIIYQDGVPLAAFKSQKGQALLCYLALTGKAHARSVLAGLLWPEMPEENALMSLRTVLNKLNHHLATHLAITRQSIAFNQDASFWVDVTVFEAGVTARSDTGRLQAAVALYQGDFLEGFDLPDAPHFDGWVLGQRARLRQAALVALHHLVTHFAGRGDHETAITYARQLLAIEPWQEEAHRELMRLLALSGQRSAALVQYETCREILAEELGVEPAPATVSLYEQIKANGLAPAAISGGAQVPVLRLPQDDRVIIDQPAALPPSNLPVQTTPFIGREEELAALGQYLADPTIRLSTILGPGGMGKTRLALEAARNGAASFADGTALVSLAPLSDSEAIVPAVAQALGFGFHSGDSRDPKTQLLDYLHSKELLLVLDNFEHLLNATPLLTELLGTAPAVKLLVTSRERLKLQAEHVYPLQGLALRQWETMADGQADPLVQLFLHHARRARPSFALRPEHLAPLQQLFRLVGGMPLAVILAAGWVEVLSPVEIAAEMGRSLDFLEAAAHDVPVRQQSMRAVFESTWARLSAGEQRLYAALSIFRGGLTMEAVQEVVGASPRDMMRLVERSLLTRVAGGRFEQHELLRQFAAQELAQTPEDEWALRGRHSAFYCRYLGEREADLKGVRALEAEAEIALELENVRAGWMWAADQRQERLLRQAAPAVGLYHGRRWLLREGAALFRQSWEQVMQSEDFSLRTGALLLAWHSLMLTRGLPDTASSIVAEGLAHQALALVDEAAARGEAVRAERALAFLALGCSHYEKPQEAVQSLETSLALFSELGMQWEMAWIHQDLAISYGLLADYGRVHEHSLQAQRLYDIVGDARYSYTMKLNIGGTKVWVGKFEEAEAAVREALDWFRENDPFHLAWAWMGLGEVLIYSGRFQEALSELAVPRASTHPFTYIYTGTLDSWATLHLGHYRRAWQEGQSWLAASREAQFQFHTGFNHLTLGWAALALERRDAARGHLQESVTAFRAKDQSAELSWARAGLGYLALHEGDAVAARTHLTEALQSVSEYHLFMAVLIALPAVALLLAQGGKPEQAVALYALASKYGFVAHSRWFGDVAGQRIAAATAALPRDVAAAARERGQELDLWETAEALLSELEVTKVAER